MIYTTDYEASEIVQHDFAAWYTFPNGCSWPYQLMPRRLGLRLLC